MSSYRSATLIAILVFGILFSLFYSSSFFANQNLEGTYQVIGSKRVELEIYRLRTPEDVCFNLDDQKLKEIDGAIMASYDPAEGTGDTLSAAIRDADSSAVSDKQMEEQLKPPMEYFESMGNRYTGIGLYFEKAEAMVSLVKSFESAFNHTVTHKVTRGYSDDIHRYSCNFSYNGNYYGLNLKFYSLRFLTAYSGFTAISIPDGRSLIGGSDSVAISADEDSTKIIRAIYPFNDTILWTNHSHYPVTLQISYKTTEPADMSQAQMDNKGSSAISQKVVTVYPNESHDEFFNNYYDSVDGIFNYTVKEHPAVHGTVVVDHYPVCSLDMQKVQLLYQHTAYPIKLPRHIPAGYDTTICMLADRGEAQLFFWNKRLLTDKLGEPGGLQDANSNIENGAIMVYEQFDKIQLGDTYTPTNATQRALQLYNQISKATEGGISLLNGGPKLIQINSHTLAVGTEQITKENLEKVAEEYLSRGQHAPSLYVSPYYRPSRLVVFYGDDVIEPVSIRIAGKVPLDQLVEMAESFGD